MSRRLLDRFTRVACAGLVLLGGAAGQAAPVDSRENLRRAFAILEQAEAKIPADAYDPVAVVRGIGYHTDDLFAWVRDNTRWLPYRGALRGPLGVIIDRGGNSLDRSLLLADFYSHLSGLKVRLAHADLSDAQAKDLFAKLRAAPRPKPVSFDPVDPQNAAGERAAQQLERVGEDVTQRTAALMPTLATAPTTGPVDVAADAIATLSDHWWLQRLDGDKWVDLDVTLPGAKPGDAVCPATTTMPVADLPVDLWHAVRISVVAERWADGKLSTATVLSRQVKPGRVIGSAIFLTHLSVDWNTAPPAGPSPADSAAARQQALVPTEWVPMLSLGAETASDNGVRPDGTVDPKPKLDQLFRAGVTAGKAASAAASAFDTAPPPAATAPPAGLFTAEWLEYTVHSPGCPDRTIRREVFDLIGPGARAAGVSQQPHPDDLARANAALTLAGRTDIVLLPCQPSPGFVGHLLLGNLRQSRDAVLKIMDAAGPGGKVTGTSAGNPLICPAPLYGFALARRMFSPCAADWFVARTNVFAQHGFARLTGDGHQLDCQATDLVTDDVAVDPWSTADPAKVRQAQGVVDTAAEGAFLPAGTRQSSAADTLAAAHVPLVAIRTAVDLSKLSAWPADVTARVASEVAAGRVVLIAASPSPAGPPAAPAWWSVDPASGQPIGIGEHGWGTDMVETSAIYRWIIANAKWVCVGASVATVASICSNLLPLGELGSDALSVVAAALDTACTAGA